MTAQTHPADLPEPVTAFVQAINSADTDAFVALFTEDGVIDDWGTRYDGHDGVHQWARSDAIGMNARMQVLTTAIDGQTVTIRFDWSSNKFSGKSTGIFVVRDGRLASFTIPPER